MTKRRYVARWWEGDVKRKRTFTRKKDRDAFTAERRRRLALGDTPVPTPDVTLAEFVEEYWRLYAVPSLAPLTRQGYASRWDLHIRPTLGGYRLRQITPIVVGQLMLRLRKEGVGEPTIRLTMLTLQSILSLAVRQERLQSNPVSRVRLPKPSAEGGGARRPGHRGAPARAPGAVGRDDRVGVRLRGAAPARAARA
jgi:hypothetical protein